MTWLGKTSLYFVRDFVVSRPVITRGWLYGQRASSERMSGRLSKRQGIVAPNLGFRRSYVSPSAMRLASAAMQHLPCGGGCGRPGQFSTRAAAPAQTGAIGRFSVWVSFFSRASPSGHLCEEPRALAGFALFNLVRVLTPCSPGRFAGGWRSARPDPRSL